MFAGLHNQSLVELWKPIELITRKMSTALKTQAIVKVARCMSYIPREMKEQQTKQRVKEVGRKQQDVNGIWDV